MSQYDLLVRNGALVTASDCLAGDIAVADGKIVKEFKSGGIMHVGLEAREHPSFFAGMALPW